MFAKRTHCGDMSKKAGFFDISQKHVQAVGIFVRGVFWRDFEIETEKRVYVTPFQYRETSAPVLEVEEADFPRIAGQRRGG